MASLLVVKLLVLSMLGRAQPYKYPDPPRTNLTMAQLLSWQKQSKSVTEFLSKVGSAEQDWLVMIAFESRSLQGASCKHPSVLIATPDARVTLRANSDSSQNGFEAVEVIEFRDKDSKTQKKSVFVARHLEFEEDSEARKKFLQQTIQEVRNGKNSPTQIPGRSELWSQISASNRDNLIAELEEEIGGLRNSPLKAGENPPVCQGCHKEDVRSNWDPYDSWRGFVRPGTGELFGKKLVGLRPGDGKYEKCIELVKDSLLKNPRFRPFREVIQRALGPLERTELSQNELYTQRLYQLIFQRINRILASSSARLVAKSVLLSEVSYCEPAPELKKIWEDSGLQKKKSEGGGLAGMVDPVLRPLGVDVYDLYPTLEKDFDAQLTTPDYSRLGEAFKVDDPEFHKIVGNYLPGREHCAALTEYIQKNYATALEKIKEKPSKAPKATK